MREINTMTANYEYFGINTENLPLPAQMQLSEKLKTFSHFFIAFFWILIKFWTFWKKMNLIVQVFLKLLTPKTCLLKYRKIIVSENPLLVNQLKICFTGARNIQFCLKGGRAVTLVLLNSYQTLRSIIFYFSIFSFYKWSTK